MYCNQCGTEFDEDQRFCSGCGTDVSSTTEPQPERVAVFPPPGDHDITAPVLYDMADHEPELLHPRGVTVTDRLAVIGPSTPADPVHTGPPSPTIGVVVILGMLTGLVALVGMFPRLVAVRTDSTSPTFSTGDWLVADLGTNLPGSLIVALLALLVGVIGAIYRNRWGYGLVGGSGLAITGWAALTIGLVERPVQSALAAANRPTADLFTVTVTRDIGYGLVLAAGVGGLLTFLASLARAGNDRRRSLNPWVAALGALAAVIAAAGPMLPEGAASLRDNWVASGDSTNGADRALFLAGRLVQLGLLAYSGVVGFLLVRRYGLAMAIGGATVSAWLAVTTALNLGTSPIGPGVANPGNRGDIDLHSVTLVGMAALVGMAIVAVIAAYDQAAREP